MNRRGKTVPEVSNENSTEQSQNATNSKLRSKNFTEEECKVIVSTCGKYFDVINKNSNREADKKAKDQAWAKIEQEFNAYCHAHAIFVSTICKSLLSLFSKLIENKINN